MAKLLGTASLNSIDWLEIKLAPPAAEADATDYTLTVATTDGLSEYEFSVATWQTEHDETWLLARAFAESGSLINSTVPMDLWRNGKGRVGAYSAQCGPMFIAISGNPIRSTVSMRLFMDETQPNLCQRFFMLTAVAAAEQFGKDLEDEIVAGAPRWARSYAASGRDAGSEDLTDLIWEAERDICYLYHALSEYTGIDGDQSYGVVYRLPYWRLLNEDVEFTTAGIRDFVVSGCLVMILAMAFDVIDGSGTYIAAELGEYRRAVMGAPEINSDIARLKHGLSSILNSLFDGTKDFEGAEELGVWANRTFVQGYFGAMCNRHN